jgi:hypothetical protein
MELVDEYYYNRLAVKILSKRKEVPNKLVVDKLKAKPSEK